MATLIVFVAICFVFQNPASAEPIIELVKALIGFLDNLGGAVVGSVGAVALFLANAA